MERGAAVQASVGGSGIFFQGALVGRWVQNNKVSAGQIDDCDSLLPCPCGQILFSRHIHTDKNNCIKSYFTLLSFPN